jgi:hypothetical protein
MFSLRQNRRTRGQDRRAIGSGGGGDEAQIMYSHVSKCKNDLKKQNKTRDGVA